MAWHWRRDGTPFHLLSRVGDDRPEVFDAFLARHAIPHATGLVTPGASASIDIVIRPDLQPHVDNFVEGVWATYALTPAEERLLATGRRLHLVLVEGAIRELDRLARAGLPARLEVTADFLGFRHYTLARLRDTIRAVDVGFIGWPGSPGDAEIAAIRDVAHELRRLIVVTSARRASPRSTAGSPAAATPSSRWRPWRSREPPSAVATRSSRASSPSGDGPGT